MAENNPKTDNWLEEPKKLPDMLNVLTILTFIGSGLAILISLYAFVNARASYEATVKMQDKIDEMPAFAKKLMGKDPVANALNMLDNRTPILLLTLVASGLCIYGAIQMRQRKKTGYSIYVLGEILPLVTSFIFLGAGSMAGFGFIFSIAFIAVFIILYGTQLKHMS